MGEFYEQKKEAILEAKNLANKLKQPVFLVCFDYDVDNGFGPGIGYEVVTEDESWNSDYHEATVYPEYD